MKVCVLSKAHHKTMLLIFDQDTCFWYKRHRSHHERGLAVMKVPDFSEAVISKVYLNHYLVSKQYSVYYAKRSGFTIKM